MVIVEYRCSCGKVRTVDVPADEKKNVKGTKTCTECRRKKRLRKKANQRGQHKHTYLDA